MNISPPSTICRWAYNDPDPSRDLRLDFIRGLVMIVLLINHFEFFSVYNFLVWERIGVVSGAEGFVIVSGLVIGKVYRRRLDIAGWPDVLGKLRDRALQLYRVNLWIIFSVAVIDWLPFFNGHLVMSFTDRVSGQVYPLYPAADAPWHIWLAQALSLKIGPHQFQIMGLYVVLLLATPITLWLLQKRLTGLLLGLSWLLYIYNRQFPTMPTGAQFEYAFPLLTWQLIYTHGVCVGFHWQKMGDFTQQKWWRPFMIACAALFVGFMFFTQNNPNPTMPAYARLSIIPAETFNRLYAAYFMKNTLGILRLLNYFVVLIIGYYLLTRYWQLWNRALGWLLIPIGQATLYVFIVHVYLLLLLSQFPVFYTGGIWLNTFLHTLALIVIWGMVRKRFLFRWIPR